MSGMMRAGGDDQSEMSAIIRVDRDDQSEASGMIRFCADDAESDATGMIQVAEAVDEDESDNENAAIPN